MRLSPDESKRIAAARQERRAAVARIERRVRDGMPALPVAAGAPKMSRRRLKKWLAGQGGLLNAESKPLSCRSFSPLVDIR